MMIFDMFSIRIYFRIVINPAISLMICKRSCFVFSDALKMKFFKWMAILESRLKLIFLAAECKNRMKTKFFDEFSAATSLKNAVQSFKFFQVKK